MALPPDLLQRVVAGTLQERRLIDATGTALDTLLVQQSSEEAQILLMSGGMHYRLRAGYVPGQVEHLLLLPECPDEKRPPCSRRALRYLYAMLQDYLIEVLPEFLQAVTARNECLPGETLPGMLDMGERRILWQGMIRPILGERGHWLAEVSGRDDWQWVWHTPTHLNVPETPTYSEDSLIRLLRKSGKILHPHHRAIESLRDYKAPWSDKLTDEFMETLRRQVRSRQFDARAYFTMALTEFAVYIPIERKHEVLQTLKIRTKATYRSKQRDRWHESAREVKEVFDFREGMLKAIHKKR